MLSFNASPQEIYDVDSIFKRTKIGPAFASATTDRPKFVMAHCSKETDEALLANSGDYRGAPVYILKGL